METTRTVAWPPDRPDVVVVIAEDEPVRVALHGLDSTDADLTYAAPLVEVGLLAEGRVGSSVGPQHRRNATSARLRAVDVDIGAGEHRLVVRQCDTATGLEVRSTLRSPARGALRAEHTVLNRGGGPLTLVYVSSLSLAGFAAAAGTDLRSLRVHRADNAWLAEGRWQEITTEAAGLVDIGSLHGGQGTAKGRYAVAGYGSWSSAGHLPMGAVSSPDGPAWVWQIEHPGAWVWELADHFGDLSLLASGPADAEHQWRRELVPGESFATAPAAS